MHTSSPFSQYSHHRLFPEVAVHPGHLVLVHLVKLGVDLLLGIDDVFPQDLLGNGFDPVCVGKNNLTGVPVHCLLASRVVLDVAANNKPGQHFILQENSGGTELKMPTRQQNSEQQQLSIPTALPQTQIHCTACTCTGSTVSLTTHRISKREMMGSVRSTFSEKVSDGSYRPPGAQRQTFKSNTGFRAEALRQTQISFVGRCYCLFDFCLRLEKPGRGREAAPQCS